MEYGKISLDNMLTSLAQELEPYVNAHDGELKAELAGGEVVCDPLQLE